MSIHQSDSLIWMLVYLHILLPETWPVRHVLLLDACIHYIYIYIPRFQGWLPNTYKYICTIESLKRQILNHKCHILFEITSM